MENKIKNINIDQNNINNEHLYCDKGNNKQNKNRTQSKTFENYPCWIIIISNLVSNAIYLIGAYIVYQVGIIWLLLYLLYIFGLEFRLMKKSCIHCYYYGKFCAFGKGKVLFYCFPIKGKSS